MAIRIREEIRKKIKQCCPPSAIIFEYFPGKESENSLSEFLLKKFNDLGMERIGFHLQSDEVEPTCGNPAHRKELSAQNLPVQEKRIL